MTLILGTIVACGMLFVSGFLYGAAIAAADQERRQDN